MRIRQLVRLSMHEPAVYRIRVQGQLDEGCFDCCGGMALRIESAGGGCPVTELTGQVPDQAALIGILNCLIDKRLSLLSVELAMEKH